MFNYIRGQVRAGLRVRLATSFRNFAAAMGNSSWSFRPIPKPMSIFHDENKITINGNSFEEFKFPIFPTSSSLPKIPPFRLRFKVRTDRLRSSLPFQQRDILLLHFIKNISPFLSLLFAREWDYEIGRLYSTETKQ